LIFALLAREHLPRSGAARAVAARAMKLRVGAPDARDDGAPGAVLPTVQRPRAAAASGWNNRLGCVLWPLGLLSLLLLLDTARRRVARGSHFSRCTRAGSACR
jgi:hypothetical protein